jgi:hypothetical protein
MRGSHRRQVRPAYTLLEVMLAGSISVLLLGALYVAVDLHVRQTKAARDRIEQATLARNLFARITSDLQPSLAATDPSRYRVTATTSQGSGNGQNGQSGQSGQSGQTGSSGMGGGSGSGGSGNSGTGSSGSGNSGSGNTNSGSATSGYGAANSSTSGGYGPNGNVTFPFLFALEGTQTTLSLYVSRVPRDELNMLVSGNVPPVPAGDQRSVSYWLASSGTGLARQDLQLVTSDNAMMGAAAVGGNDSQYVIAPEVQSLTFSYFDGTNWNDTWDATVPGGNDNVPIGPPVAIQIILGLAPPGTPAGTTVDADQITTYRHVIFLPTSNGAAATQQGTTGTTTTSGN